MVVNHTFYFNYWSLVVGLVIIQGYINLWHTPGHIIDGSSFLDVINPLTILLSVWAVSQEMFFSATPAFQRFSLWVISLHWYGSRSFISTQGGKILVVHTPGWEAHSWVLLIVLKSWGFNSPFLKSWTILLFPSFVRFFSMPKLFMTIGFLSNSILFR